MRLEQKELEKLSFSDLILLRKESELIQKAVSGSRYYESSETLIGEIRWEIESEIESEIVDRIRTLIK